MKARKLIKLQQFSLLFIALFLIGCSTNKVVVKRIKAPPVQLSRGASIEVQDLQGPNSKSFQMTLNQFLTERTPFKIIYSQSRDELIDSMLRGKRNKQTYAQADLIIRGSIQENVERRTGENGTVQFAVISRPFLQLIEATSGKIIFSKHFVGASQSSTYILNSNTNYDGYTDALINARRIALENFISYLTPQDSWLEIELLPLKNETKYEEIKNLIHHGRYKEAKKVLKEYISLPLVGDPAEKGRALFSLSVVESLLGNYGKAKSLILTSNQLIPDERIMRYIGVIDSMELESKRELKYE